VFARTFVAELILAFFASFAFDHIPYARRILKDLNLLRITSLELETGDSF